MCRILVVDDESLVLALLDRVLRDAGYQTVLAASGDEAVSLAQNDAKSIDLLITDLKMPGMSGQETAARICVMRPRLPVIYMSGFCDRAAAGLNALGGSTTFIPKPFSKSMLLNAVNGVLNPQTRFPQAASA